MSEPRQAVVHIINKFKVKRKAQAFHCVMIYQDLATQFCIVKPLLQKHDLEIAMELFKIFTSYGPPDELDVNSCTQDVVDNVEEHIRNLYPMFNVKFSRKNGEFNDIAMKVVTELHKWMESLKKDEWEIGCSIVQQIINSQTNEDGSSPQERLFKHTDKTYVPDNEYLNSIEIAESNDKISSDTVKVKEEIENNEYANTLVNDRIVFEGGVIFPGLKKMTNPQVDVKMERLDE